MPLYGNPSFQQQLPLLQILCCVGLDIILSLPGFNFEMDPIEDDIGLSDQDLVLMSTEDFKKYLERTGISKDREKGTYTSVLLNQGNSNK